MCRATFNFSIRGSALPSVGFPFRRLVSEELVRSRFYAGIMDVESN
jgi:hypothetical protein